MAHLQLPATHKRLQATHLATEAWARRAIQYLVPHLNRDVYPRRAVWPRQMDRRAESCRERQVCAAFGVRQRAVAQFAQQAADSIMRRPHTQSSPFLQVGRQWSLLVRGQVWRNIDSGPIA